MNNHIKNLIALFLLLLIGTTMHAMHAMKVKQEPGVPIPATSTNDASICLPTDVTVTVKDETTPQSQSLADQKTTAERDKATAEAFKAKVEATKGLVDISTNVKVLAVVLAPVFVVGGLISAAFGKNPFTTVRTWYARHSGTYTAQAEQAEKLATSEAIKNRTPQEQRIIEEAEQKTTEIVAATDRYKQCLTVYPQSGRAIPLEGVVAACAAIKEKPVELQMLMLEKERYEQCMRDYPKSGRTVPLDGIAGACSTISNDPVAIQQLSSDVRISEEARTQIAKNTAQYLACVPYSGYASVGGCAASAIPLAVNLVGAYSAIRGGLFPQPAH